MNKLLKLTSIFVIYSTHSYCAQMDLHTFLSQYLKIAPNGAQALTQNERDLSQLKLSFNPWNNQLSVTGQWFQERDLLADSTTGKGENYAFNFTQELPTGTKLSLTKNYTHYREDSLGKGGGHSWEFELSQDLLKNGFGKNNYQHIKQIELQNQQGHLLHTYANAQDCLEGSNLFAGLWLSQQLKLESKQTAELAKKVQQTYRQLLSQKLLSKRFWPGILLDTMAREREALEYDRQYTEKLNQAQSYSVVIDDQTQFELPQSLMNNITSMDIGNINLANAVAIKAKALQISKSESIVADNENLPRLEVFFNYDENRDDYIFSQTNEDEKKFGLRLTIRPLETWQQNAIAAKRSQVRLDELKLNETVRSLEVQLLGLSNKMQQLKMQQTTFEVEEKLAADQFKTNQTLFQEGRIDLVDYQNARDKLTQTKIARLKNTYELLLAIFDRETTLRGDSSYCPTTEAKL